MSFFVFNGILLLLVLFLLLVLSMVWPPDSPWAPWWRTNKKVAYALCKLAQIKKSDVVYDLGCGDATVLYIAATHYGVKGVGIEIDPLRYWIAKIRMRFMGPGKQVQIKRANFFDVPLHEASVIVVYLVPKTLQRLKPKFQKELKKGTRIVSYRYQMNLPLLAEDKMHQLFLYSI